MDIFAEYEAERLRELNSPEALAEEARASERSRERLVEARALGLREGWCDVEGNSLLQDDPEEDDDGEA